MNAILFENGYAPMIIRSIDRHRYLSSLETYQTKGDSDAYYKFMLTALNRSLKMAIDLLDVNAKEPTKDMLTIAKFAELCDVRVSSIRYWMQEGKIKPATFTKSGYALFEKAQAKDVKKLAK